MSTTYAHSGLDNEEGMPVTEMRTQASYSPVGFLGGRGGREHQEWSYEMASGMGHDILI